MQEHPQNGQAHIEKLQLGKEDTGWFQRSDIPFRIFYVLNSRGAIVAPTNPADHFMGQDNESGEKTLSILIHESVPPPFKEILLYREMQAVFYLQRQEMPAEEADMQAMQDGDAYARTHLAPAEYVLFKEWERMYRVKGSG